MRIWRKPWLAWTAFAVLVLALFGTGWAVISNNLYSAAGTVSQYLAALERHDVKSALSIPGVLPHDADINEELLRASALGKLTNAYVTGEKAGAGGTRVVTAHYTVGSGTSATSGSTSFVMKEATGSWWLVPQWMFAEAPLATINVNVQHSTMFTAGTSPLIDIRAVDDAQAGNLFNASAPFAVLVPQEYSFSITGENVSAKSSSVFATKPGDAYEATIAVQLNPKIAERVEKQLTKFLDECVAQEVLQPAGCPFGYETGNRIVGTPTWSVVTYPTVTITAGDNGWVAANLTATVHISAQVQSLYDGSITQVEEDIPANFTLNITVNNDGSLNIVLS